MIYHIIYLSVESSVFMCSRDSALTVERFHKLQGRSDPLVVTPYTHSHPQSRQQLIHSLNSYVASSSPP